MTAHGLPLVTAGLLVAAALGSGPTAPRPIAHGQSPVAIPVAVIGGQRAPGGANPTVEVEMGRWGPIPVLLDTGSSGLHVFAGVVNAGSGVTVGTQKSNITYSGGVRFTGVVASAVVTLGGQATTGPIPFALVQRASCIASKSNCPASGGIAGFENTRGVDGILGIGMQSSGGGVSSPILGMPGDLGERWNLHLSATSGRLTLGARIPAGPRATRIALRTAGTAGGHALWADDRVPLCVTAGAERECVHGLFDSGTPEQQISGPELDQTPTVSGTSDVVPGTPMTATLKGAAAPFWSFTAGTAKSEDLVRVMDGQGPFFNSGVQAFYDFTVSYDETAGTITLEPSPTVAS